MRLSKCFNINLFHKARVKVLSLQYENYDFSYIRYRLTKKCIFHMENATFCEKLIKTDRNLMTFELHPQK